MNKKELRKAIIELPVDCSGLRPKIDQLKTLKLIKLLDEPEKVKVPQFVADWIEEAKTIYSISGGLTCGGTELNKWLAIDDNQETFVLAWLFGYDVEKEKRYIIKFKNIQKGTKHLKYDRVIRKWYFGLEEYSTEKSIYHTKKELEEDGFGWVFDCPGIEIEEVE